jgi:SAM-dependent methyltransferase
MALAQFVREYRTVRRAEGWGSSDPAYYRALPYRDLTGRFGEIWKIRARSFELFVERVLAPLERRASAPLRILDLGAGSGWLAHRLAQRDHRVAALDILDDPLDGLGAVRHYAADVWPVIAEFDHLPLSPHDFDLVIFNASLHYSTDYANSLRESLRVVRPGGTLVILDSPMYSNPESGARMVREREARFLATYGFASNVLPSEHYLTPTRLAELSRELGIAWRVYLPSLDWQSQVRRTFGGLRARREPARFPVIVGTPA